MRRRLLLALLAATSHAGALDARAQAGSALEIGSGLERAARDQVEPGLRLAPRLEARAGWLEGAVEGSVTRFRAPEMSSSLRGHAALRAPEWRCLALSATVGGERSDYAHGPGARRLEAGARVVCAAADGVEWWAGGMAGRVSATETRALAALEIGTRLGSVGRSVVLSVRTASLGEVPGLFRDSVSFLANDTLHLNPIVHRVVDRPALPAESWLDLSARLGWARGRLGADLDLGTRLRGRDAAPERWALGTLAYRWSPALALVAGYGTTPSDPGIGVPAARRVMLSLRVTRPPRATAPAARAAAFSVVPLRPGVQALTARVPGARSLEIAGDFTDWTPVPLRPAGDQWVTELALAPGSYRVNLRVDGTRWMAPPGLPVEPDDFGGTVGILVVPGTAAR